MPLQIIFPSVTKIENIDFSTDARPGPSTKAKLHKLTTDFTIKTLASLERKKNNENKCWFNPSIKNNQ